jgi:cytochrome c
MSKTNTFAGWVLAGGIAALGLSIVTGMVYKSERPEKMGFPIEGVEEGGGGGEAAVVVPIALRIQTADAAKGADVFKNCQACHTINQGGANGIGPNLYGTMGEPIGQGKGGFAFSDALKGVGGNWDFDKMDAWLTSPRKFASGTKMTFAGIADGAKRADLIAYLNAQGSNLPLPAAPAAGAPAEPAGNAAEPANIANEAGLTAGAPSKDPAAAVQAEKKGH